MADFAGDQPHVAHLLGLYYLDSLDPSQGDGIERHLQSCAACRATAEETCEAIAALALLNDERDELLDNYGALNRRGGAAPAPFARFFGPETPGDSGPLIQAGRPKDISNGSRPPVPADLDARPKPAPARPKPAELDDPAWQRPSGPDWGRPDGTIPDGPVGPLPAKLAGPSAAPPAAKKPAMPAANKPAMPVVSKPAMPAVNKLVVNKPPMPVGGEPDKLRLVRRDDLASPSAQRRPRRTRALVGAGALLTLVLAVGGLAVGALVNGMEQPPAESKVVTAAATAADSTTGASVAVFVTEHENNVNVRATVNGLRTGAGYRLRAVTTDGRTLAVVNWTGTGSVQDVTGDVPVRLAQLSYFTVTRPDNTAVVSVYLPQGSGPAATPTS